MPALMILAGYYVSGRFFVRPSASFEAWLAAWDRRLLGDPTTRFARWPQVVLAYLENRRYGPRPLRQRALAWLAGVLFALDLIAWHYGIEQVGAGLATVLGNLQVVFVGLLAWAILGERPSNRSLAAIPVALFGVLLISGIFESGAYGKNPGLGVAYGGPVRGRAAVR